MPMQEQTMVDDTSDTFQRRLDRRGIDDGTAGRIIDKVAAICLHRDAIELSKDWQGRQTSVRQSADDPSKRGFVTKCNDLNR